MKMTIRLTNGNLPDTLFNQFCFMLQMAGPCEATDNGVVFSGIDAGIPLFLPEGSAVIVTAETYYRYKIREVCARVCGWFGEPGEKQLQYGLQISYEDIEPKLLCANMLTSQTSGYPACERMDCAARISCHYAPEHTEGQG